MLIGLHPDDIAACKSERLCLDSRPRLYGVGPGKTGTNVLASIFTKLPSAHEAEAESLITTILEYKAGRAGWRCLRDLIAERDRRLGLAVDVSNLNVFLLELLVEMAPGAVFVLTIRDPYSWLDSMLNHYLRHTPSALWKDFSIYRFAREPELHPPEERVLSENGLFSLAGYLSYWRAHIEEVLAAVPTERLFVVRTDMITSEANNIAKFAGFPTKVVDRSRIHEYRNPNKLHILQRISQKHLEEQVRMHCEPLATRLFPEIGSLEDSKYATPACHPS